MRKRIVALAVLAALVPTVSVAQMQIAMQETQEGTNRFVRFEAVDEAVQDGENTSLLELNTLLESRLMQGAAKMVALRAGAQIDQQGVVWQNDQVASVALLWNGTQLNGLNGSSAYTLAADLETGEELSLDALSGNEEAIVQAMETIIDAQVLPTLSDYMEYAELLPVPRDCFAFDAQGLTVYYPDDRYRWFDGSRGAVHFAWFELQDAVGENSLLYALSRPDAADEAKIRAQTEAGYFQGAFRAELGDLLKDVLAQYKLLSEPDYTTYTRVYQFEDAPLRGWAAEIPRYADTNADETPICAIRTSRIAFCGLVTGTTTREEIVALLGEPDAVIHYDEGDAMDRMLGTAGDSLFYQGKHVLELHLDESGVLHTAIIETTMPDNLY